MVKMALVCENACQSFQMTGMKSIVNCAKI